MNKKSPILICGINDLRKKEAGGGISSQENIFPWTEMTTSDPLNRIDLEAGEQISDQCIVWPARAGNHWTPGT